MTDNQTARPATLRIPADQLHAYVTAIWVQAGSTPREAALVADHLVAAI
jgi:uncharacterized oxidoreductase